MAPAGPSPSGARVSGRLRGRRRRLLTRALPLVVVAAAAFTVGLIAAGGPTRAERALAARYARAWARGDTGAMYRLLAPGSRHRLSYARFSAELAAAARTATLLSLVVGSIGHPRSDWVPVHMVLRTRVFGTLREVLRVTLSATGEQVRFSSALLLPGLRPGETLSRTTGLGARGTLLADDGTPLAQGPARTSPVPAVAGEIVGRLGPIPAAEAAAYAADGYPPGAKVGLDGLERIFEPRLAGTPGGTLLAGGRVLAASRPVAGGAVRTTIDPAVESAMISAIAGRYAGMVAMDPRTGALLGLAGVAFSAPQPPGSTMKIITSTAALEAGITSLDATFPVQTGATIEGYTLQNANGEACGGTLINAFAVSCNSVFAPLGARLGAARLVAMAERFGFNSPPGIPGAAESTIPSAASIGGQLDVASSAIGQGKVQATALEMTDVAATIAMSGRRPLPTLIAGLPPRFVPVTDARVAGLVERMMVAVVRDGTGTAAQVPGVTVAGKTGTAELRSTVAPAGGGAAPTNTTKDTDAWFVGYAPVGAPRIVVGALFPAQGAGGATAAPAARDVLVAGLTRH